MLSPTNWFPIQAKILSSNPFKWMQSWFLFQSKILSVNPTSKQSWFFIEPKIYPQILHRCKVSSCFKGLRFISRSYAKFFHFEESQTWYFANMGILCKTMRKWWSSYFTTSFVLERSKCRHNFTILFCQQCLWIKNIFARNFYVNKLVHI